MSLAAVAAGANALMIEAHTDPELSLVDAAQTVNPDELREIIDSCRRIRRIETAVV
jgi:3-deoxy-7-phosphoheptulonate synthase